MLDRSVAHQEGIGWSQENSVLRLGLPTEDVLRSDDAILDHAQILLSQGDAFGIKTIAYSPTKFSYGLNQIGGDFSGIIVSMEAEPRLRQNFTEETAEEMIQFIG